MNIGIDARLLYNETGIGRYTRSLFFEFVKQHRQDDHYYLLFDKDLQELPELDEFTEENILYPLPSNFSSITARCKTRIVWSNVYAPRLLRQHHVALYHAVCNFELPIKKPCRYVVTIHDLVPLFFPKLVPKKHLLFFTLFMKRAAHTADLIITDSEHSKQDIIHYLAVPETKVRVIYLGYDPRYQQIDDQQAIQEVLSMYGIRQPYLLFVGVIEPKKNLTHLVEAFHLLRQDRRIGKEVQLVIAGGKGWFYDDLYRRVQDLRLEQQVVFTGFISDHDLPYLYNGAEVFVFPSIYEGFGLPILEAMACGVPVVTANVSSLPEIVGDAGKLVDPNSPEAIWTGIADVLLDSATKERMRQDGLARARQFSWQRTAAETYKVYQEAYQL